jgi:hypothetical protein
MKNREEAVSQLETVFLCFFYVFFLHKRLIFCIFISDLQMIIYEIQALQSTSNHTFTLFV